MKNENTNFKLATEWNRTIETFQSVEAAKAWIDANCTWEVTIASSDMLSAHYEGQDVHLYETDLQICDSGVKLAAVWVRSQSDYITCKSNPATKWNAAEQTTATPSCSFSVSCPDGTTVELKAWTANSAVLSVATASDAVGIYSCNGRGYDIRRNGTRLSSRPA